LGSNVTGIRGRDLSKLVRKVRGRIGSGLYASDDFLPSTRDLAAEFGMSAETVRRGLKVLEEEGLLVGQPRSGFRVAGRRDVRSLKPVAFMTSYSDGLRDAQPATLALSLALQNGAAARGWSVQSVNCQGLNAGAIGEKLAASGCWGAVLDSKSADLYELLSGSGLPFVMAGAWTERVEVDLVLQDNYRGGFFAAEHLVSRGRKRIGWIGPIRTFPHCRERYAGATAALYEHGLSMAPEFRRDVFGRQSVEAARELLSGDARPDGLLAFSPMGIGSAKRAAEAAGLVIGRDLDVVGWVVNECYDLHYRSLFDPGCVPPAVTWSAREMADRALSLLAERSEDRERERVRLCVPAELRFEEEG
jgi:DNA-binding LacI/PurR family transcriptional regulator